MSERHYWMAFSQVKGFGPVRFRTLLAGFGALRDAWYASADDLRKAGITQAAIDSLLEARQKIDPGVLAARLDKAGVIVLTWEDSDYPPLLHTLSQIDQAPPVIYLRGSIATQDEIALTIIGTRDASPYGRQVAYEIARELASNGVTVVSGLAKGIDSEAHRGALDANGRTIGVLANGLDRIYPQENRPLAVRIIRQGALMSPFPIGMPAQKNNFSPRNQMLSGLSLGVLVIEAGEKSGALMTAGFALEQGREVFAIPGNITAKGSIGTNRLIRDGAIPVVSSQDVLDALNIERMAHQTKARAELPSLTDVEQIVIEMVTQEPWHIDEICRQSDLPIAQVSSALTMLQLKGLVREVGSLIYIRT